MASRRAARGMGGPRKPVPNILADMIIKAGTEQVLEVEIEGEILELPYRPLGWLAKSRCISQATQVSAVENPETGGNEVKAQLRLDIYNRLVLRSILHVDFPLTDAFFESIPPSLGKQLETIIPSPFVDDEGISSEKKESQDLLEER